MVLGDLMKRLMNGVVLVLAAITFFLVPIGRKTAAQHVVSIFTTPPAREAASAVAGVARKAAHRAGDALAEIRRGHAHKPIAPAPEPDEAER